MVIINLSNWIRIEMPSDSTPPPNAMPYGHGSYSSHQLLDEIHQSNTPMLLSMKDNKDTSMEQYLTEESPDGILELPRSARDTSELFAPLPYLSDDARTWILHG